MSPSSEGETGLAATSASQNQVNLERVRDITMSTGTGVDRGVCVFFPFITCAATCSPDCPGAQPEAENMTQLASSLGLVFLGSLVHHCHLEAHPVGAALPALAAGRVTGHRWQLQPPPRPVLTSTMHILVEQ